MDKMPFGFVRRETYLCRLCDKVFYDKNKYMDHLKSKTEEDWDDIQDKLVEKPRKTMLFDTGDVEDYEDKKDFYEEVEKQNKEEFTHEEIVSMAREMGMMDDLDLKKEYYYSCPSCMLRSRLMVMEAGEKGIEEIENETEYESKLIDGNNIIISSLFMYDKHLLFEHGILVDRKKEDVEITRIGFIKKFFNWVSEEKYDFEEKLNEGN